MKDFVKRPFSLKGTPLPSNIFCAPLAGCSDFPFRKMTSQHKPGLVYCEMVKMDALVRHDPHTYRLLEYDTGMHPIGAQLCGSRVEYAAQCAKIIEDLGFDVIDLNCGCPVDKVTKDGSGSGLLKQPERIGEILSEMIRAVKIPVTVKIRTGWNEQTINCVKITQIAESAGAAAICIHGRTREQGYSGFANWDHIKACKQAAKEIKVIGNGDVFDAFAAKRLFEETGCDAILIARGTMGQPWIIDDIYALFEGREVKKRSGPELQQAFLSHMETIISYQNEKKSILDMRRVGCWYLKNIVSAKPLREAINRAKSLSEIQEGLLSFDWQNVEYKEAPLQEAGASCC